MFSCIVTDECNEYRKSVIAEKVLEFTQSLDDPWPANVVSPDAQTGIINDGEDRVALYLSNLRMLWDLGLKKAQVTRDPNPFEIIKIPHKPRNRAAAHVEPPRNAGLRALRLARARRACRCG